MKKYLSLFLAIIILSFSACSSHKTYTTEDVAEIVSPYMYNLSIGLSGNWDSSEDDNLLTKVGGNIFKAVLESFWRIDNNTEIYDEDYKVKLDDYVSIALEYFGYDEAVLTEHFKSDKSYDEQTKMLNSSDGLGSVINMEIASVEQEGDTFKINYDCYGVDGYYVEDYGYLIVQITEVGKPKFLSNTTNAL